MKYYFYIIQDTKTKKYYGGSRTSKFSDPSQLFNSNHKKPYFTSSKTVKKLIEEGHSFSVRKIKTFEDKQKCLDYETEFLRKIKVTKNHQWLNNSYSFPVIPNSWKNKTEEERKIHSFNISKGRKGIVFSEEHKQNLRKTNIEKRNSEEGYVCDTSYVTDEYRKLKSDKQKEVWRLRKEGKLPPIKPNKKKRVWFTDGKVNRFSIDGDIDQRYVWGKRPLMESLPTPPNPTEVTDEWVLENYK